MGSLNTLVYSLTAGLAAVTVSCALYTLAGSKLSLTAISVASAVVHNITQNLVFVLISQTKQMLWYTPYLALSGVLAGLIVGIGSTLLIGIIKNRLDLKPLK